MESSYTKVIFPAPFQSSSSNPAKSMGSVVFASSLLYNSVRFTAGVDVSLITDTSENEIEPFAFAPTTSKSISINVLSSSNL